VQALRAVGARVEYCSGNRMPDLWCCYQNHWIPMEVKSASGKRTPSQDDTQYPIVRTAAEALRLLGGIS
jgi:hypothetical protein